MAALLAGLALTAPVTASAADGPWMNKALSPDRRADLLAAAMTLEQKLTLFSGSGSGASAIPELGIPARREIDGATGVITAGTPTTAFPAGVSLASTGSAQLARDFGRQVGLETHLTGFSGWAGPSADLVRSPYNGRQWATYGEDPLLGGVLPAAVVDGVNQTSRSNGVYSLTKHYVANNQETQRATLNAEVDERTLRELYLRQWEPIVAAGPGAIMCAYPQVNGSPACESPELLWDVLKGELGFPGWVSSDFNACKTLDAYLYGADVCGPSTPTEAEFRQAVQDETIPRQRFNDMVHRVLRTYFASGLIDNPPPGSLQNPKPAAAPLPADVVASGRERAYQIAVNGSVLLRNQAGSLPLNDNALDSVAVIGEGADRYISGFGSDFGADPTAVSTILDGIIDRAGADVDVTHVDGADPVRVGDNLPGAQPVPSSVLQPASGTGSGLTAQWFTNSTFSGTPVVTRTEDQVNWGEGLAAVFGTFGYDPSPAPKLPLPFLGTPNPSVRWTGSLRPTVSGSYQLGVSLLGRASLWIDGEQILSANADALDQESVEVELEAGQTYQVRLDYVADAPNQCCSASANLGPAVRLTWTPPSNAASPQIRAAVRAARAADVAVVVANNYMGESLDRGSLSLPQNQDRLINAVAAANPNTIVVLTTGGAVTMPWLNRVAGVMQAWYPGQEQGRAVAALLFGDENFSGKLPISWPRSAAQAQAIGQGNPVSDVNNPDITLGYDEGVNVGYRAYDQANQNPQFAFGYGLSYARFTYGALQIQNPRARNVSRPNAYRPGSVRVRVTNRTDVAGTEIVQVYHGRLPTSRVTTPKKQLLGWARVQLDPGESRWVTVPVRLYDAQHKLAYWDAEWNAWITPTGRTPIYVGSSSRDIRRTGQLTVRTP